jgi:hypothetical protein
MLYELGIALTIGVPIMLSLVIFHQRWVVGKNRINDKKVIGQFISDFNELYSTACGPHGALPEDQLIPLMEKALELKRLYIAEYPSVKALQKSVQVNMTMIGHGSITRWI